MVITDGYYSDLTYNAGVGNADGNNGEPYADNFPDTLADIAMRYYEEDLHPGPEMPNLVPVNRLDKVSRQHMATFAISFGVTGKLNRSQYDLNLRDANGNPIHWPAVTDNRSPETIDDLWHATVNGHGLFFNARKPQEIAEAINEIIEAIGATKTGSAAPVTVNCDPIYGKMGANLMMYQATYSSNEAEWTGDLKGFGFDTASGKPLTSPGTWSAAQALELKDPEQRIIAAYKPVDPGRGGIPFRLASLSQAQIDALGTNPGNKVSYLRGAAVTGWRSRSQKLGDIVNSGPVIADELVYVGANDGMLHAFRARTGEEHFAYIPNLIFGNLKQLSLPAYTRRPYVDLTPTVTAGVTLSAGSNRTLLVGGLGGGGRGYFALDITGAKNITSETELGARVLWEFTDIDMGFSYSKPVVVKSNSTATPWVVIFGNGYNSPGEKSVLYVVDARNGQTIRKIEADAGPGNGLSSPTAVDADMDGDVDFVYAGDLNGKLWKFDLHQPNPGDWKAAFQDAGNNNAPAPLFQALGPTGAPQPITTRPDVMRHPAAHGTLVCFGTGKFMGESDFTDLSVQSVYGIWDYGDANFDSKTKTWSASDPSEFAGVFTRGTQQPLSNQASARLLEQVAVDYPVTVNNKSLLVRIMSRLKPDWSTATDPQGSAQMPDPTHHIGYFVDLPAGERVVSDVLIRGGILMVAGFRPESAPCGNGGGSTMFMELNAFTGGNLNGPIIDIDGNHAINSGDLLKVTLPSNPPEDLPVCGILFSGNLQPPVILRLNGEIEKKYFSASTGVIEELTEKALKLGVTHWMEVRY